MEKRSERVGWHFYLEDRTAKYEEFFVSITMQPGSKDALKNNSDKQQLFDCT